MDQAGEDGDLDTGNPGDGDLQIPTQEQRGQWVPISKPEVLHSQTELVTLAFQGFLER